MAEQDVESMADDLQELRTRGELIRQQIMQMQQSVAEIGSTIEALENLKKIKGEVLMPLGAGTFAFYPKPDSEKVLITVGSNLLIQKSPQEAIELLKAREERLRSAMLEAQNDLKDVINSIQELTTKIAALSQSGEKNV
jgi:prefoldin alpha subunit